MAGRSTTLRQALATSVVAATLLLVACTPEAPEAPEAPETLEELTAETYRSRFDAAAGGMQLSVTNGGNVAIVVTRTSVTSPGLSGAAESVREVEIPPGLTRDIPVALPSPACAGAPELDSVSASLTVRADTETTSPEASPASVTIVASDRLGQFAEWWRASCFAEAVAERATLAIRYLGDGAAGTAPPDTVALEFVAEPRTPRGDAGVGTVALTGISSTILLGMLDDAGAPVTSRPLQVVIDAGGENPAAIRLTTVPARCDPHAIAEDKQGTLFRVDATIAAPNSGAGVADTPSSGTVTVAADDATRDALYDAITRVCAARVGTG